MEYLFLCVALVGLVYATIRLETVQSERDKAREIADNLAVDLQLVLPKGARLLAAMALYQNQSWAAFKNR